VFLLLLIWNVRLADGNLAKAIEHISEMNLASFVLLLGAVILTTVITQAFEFEAIRLLEGYWGPGRVRTMLADRRCRRHLAKRSALRARQADLEDRAFPYARVEMLRSKLPREVVDIIEGEHTNNPVGSPSDEDQADADSVWFMDYATIEERRRHADLTLAQQQYPGDHLILPTRLGNTLRAYEEPLHGTSEIQLENRVRAVLHKLPSMMRGEHARVRSRLDLYCSLAVVFALSGLTAVAALASLGAQFSAVAAALAGTLTWLSYRAAIASAREYGRVLQAIVGFQASLPSADAPLPDEGDSGVM
jgi:hypothetical protein